MSDDDTAIRDLIAPHVGEVGGLITALRRVQGQHGHIPQAATQAAADLFNLSLAEIRGVVSFYSDFSDKPLGKTVIRVCQAEACQAVGARACTRQAASALGVALGETREDGEVSLLPVYCLGLCASGPALMIDAKPFGRAEGDRLEALLAEYMKGEGE